MTTIIIAFILNGTLYANTFSDSIYQNEDAQRMYEEAIEKSNSSPALSMQLLHKCSEYYAHQKDTVMLIKSLLTLTEIQRINLHFSKSYDNAWKTLLLAEKINNKEYLEKVYENLGVLYSIFRQEEQARDYLEKSLIISKQRYNKNDETSQALVSRYYNLVMLYNQFLKTDISTKYLDSCFAISDKMKQDTIKRGYLYAEKANIYLITQEYEAAEELLLQIISRFENIDEANSSYLSDKGYLVVLYSFLGDVYAWQQKFEEAAIYFNKSLDAIEQFNAHKGIKADLLYKLAYIYTQKNDYKLAYTALFNSKQLGDSIFGSKSTVNNELLEIKNKYREEIEAKNTEIAKKNALLYEKERHFFRIKMSALGAVALLVIALLFLRNKAQRKKHKLKEESDLEMIKVKNRELTAYTLQFIEKEKRINELADFIKKNLPDHKENAKLTESAQNSIKNYWDEFNARFVEVNQRFYKTLSERYPTLTSVDLKHCALIKLNFSAKEISQLLGISDSSVHTAHYRMRKKMGIDRTVNLSNFIASI